ncbi:MAG: helix-turn-helix domain-containing protein [Armatimonadota bacterium]|nr:helix-turn-helix domain-containing protein [Armatimonadota bacterium]
MIRNESEYQAAEKRLKDGYKLASQQKAALAAQNLSPEEVERGMEPLLCFYSQIEEEITGYKNALQRKFTPVLRLNGLGQLLISLRIANNLTQRELADRLGVNESAISRDERNEYHGLTMERAQRILDALGESVNVKVSGSASEMSGATINSQNEISTGLYPNPLTAGIEIVQ